MSKLCKIEDHRSWDKSFQLWIGDGDYDLTLGVDYDDVNHPEVDASIKALTEILEKHQEEYLALRNKYVAEIPKCGECGCYLLEDGTCDWCN